MAGQHGMLFVRVTKAELEGIGVGKWKPYRTLKEGAGSATCVKSCLAPCCTHCSSCCLRTLG